jgi:peroxiredoxin Q/BCP
VSKQVGAEVGKEAPEFSLPDGEGQEWRLSTQRGKVVVLLFYPGDSTPVCTKQMCSVRDRWEEYTASGAEVVGISRDTVESHERFAAQNDLPLRLLSDAEGVVTNAYGVNSWLPNRAARSVFVIDAQGIVRYREVKALSLFRPDNDQIIKAIMNAAA